MTHHSKFLPLLSALFITALIVSNIVAVKIGSFFGYFVTVAVILFPITYILGDIITEVYGFATTRRLIWTGFLCNLIAVLVIVATIKIPAAPFFTGAEAYAQTLGFVWRILGASFVAYLIGSFVNSYVLSRLKIFTKGKHLPVRKMVSSFFGQGLDSVIFISLAFGGVFAWADVGAMILTQWVFKMLFELILLPLTYVLIQWFKKSDNSDVYDTGTNYNPFAF